MIFRLLDSIASRYLDFRRRRLERLDGYDPDSIKMKGVNATVDEDKMVIDFYAETPGLAAFAEEVATFYESHGGPNYLDLKVYSPRGIYVISITPIRIGVKPKFEIIEELKARVKELEDEVTALRAYKYLWDRTRNLGEVNDNACEGKDDQ